VIVSIGLRDRCHGVFTPGALVAAALAVSGLPRAALPGVLSRAGDREALPRSAAARWAIQRLGRGGSLIIEIWALALAGVTQRRA
jgi:hypothetical protein